MKPAHPSQPLPVAKPRQGLAPPKLRGEAVYVFAYDLGYDMRRYDMPTLLSQPLQPFRPELGRRSPRSFSYFRPQTLQLPPVERQHPRHGPLQVQRVVKLFPVGAVSISLRVAFEVDGLLDLIDYHELEFEGSSVELEAESLARQALDELRAVLIRPAADIGDVEAYTVFCLATPSAEAAFSAPEWLAENRAEVAQLLTAEPGPQRLSDQEAAESSGVHLSYYEHDLLVVDWDAALVIDAPDHFEETLHVIELANVQLAEMGAYDRLLDRALERSYRDVARPALRHRREMLQDLREIRIDLTRFADELSNITKFFGDWHVARVYQALATRFHLPEWDASVEAKLRDLDSFYQLLKQDQLNRWMFWLEFAIVALFVIDLVVLFWEIATRPH